MKKILLFVIVLTTLILSACAAPVTPTSQGAPQPSVQNVPAQQVNPVQPRTISVNGTGQVTLSPDVAYVYIGVHSQSADVSDALAQNNDKAQAVASALKELGIDAKDIQTSGFNIYPQQQVDQQGQVTGTLYNVDNTVYVTVRDLQVLGKLLDVVVRTGANSINGISFDVLDKSQGLSEARRLAIESARSQADEIAQAAGVSLGDLQTLNVYTSNPPVPIYEGKGGAAAMDASQVPVSAGQLILRVEVSAVYTIR
jgi:uncharacterized protein YggE